jgi:hypothetical protein
MIKTVHQFAPFKSGQQLMARIADLTKDVLSLTFTGDQSILKRILIRFNKMTEFEAASGAA